IQVSAQAGLRIAERLGPSAGMEIGIAHQARAEGKIPDLTFEILDFVKVARPMERAVGDAAAATKSNRVAQTFAKLGEVPNATVLSAVIVAGGASDVLLEGHARV